MLCLSTQDGEVVVKSSDQTSSTGGGNGNPLQYSCLENSVNNMKRQKDTTPEGEPPRSEVSNMPLEEQRAAPERMDHLGQSRNDAQLWMCLMVKVKSDAARNSII